MGHLTKNRTFFKKRRTVFMEKQRVFVTFSRTYTRPNFLKFGADIQYKTNFPTINIK